MCLLCKFWTCISAGHSLQWYIYVKKHLYYALISFEHLLCFREEVIITMVTTYIQVMEAILFRMERGTKMATSQVCVWAYCIWIVFNFIEIRCQL